MYDRCAGTSPLQLEAVAAIAPAINNMPVFIYMFLGGSEMDDAKRNASGVALS
jgi:hypothetical protein